MDFIYLTLTSQIFIHRYNWGNYWVVHFDRRRQDNISSLSGQNRCKFKSVEWFYFWKYWRYQRLWKSYVDQFYLLVLQVFGKRSSNHPFSFRKLKKKFKKNWGNFYSWIYGQTIYYKKCSKYFFIIWWPNFELWLWISKNRYDYFLYFYQTIHKI